jgi:thiol-disulfide isomerase/thioredoxin
MSHLRSALVGALGALIAAQAGAAFAAQREAFTPQAFAAAQAAGRPILVDVAANWCPICHAQEPIIEKLSADPKFDQLVIFRLDFDAQRDAWRGMGVRMQSTLIAFHGTRETARSVGETQAGPIAQVLAASLR